MTSGDGEWGGDTNFLSFDYVEAHIFASNGNSLRMVESLNKMAESKIKKDSSLTERTGLAFLNLAKNLDRKGLTHRIAARHSLSYATDYYSKLRQNFVFDGLTESEVKDYIKNPTSRVSLVNLSIRLS